MTAHYDGIDTPIGAIYLILKGSLLAGVSIWQEPSGLKRGPVPACLAGQFRSYFEGALKAFDYPLLAPEGTDFERKIWLSLFDIPYGQTRSYKWIAERAGRPGASRAAGQALSKNPLAIVLPCHRVIESGGGPGGYSPSPDIKRRLLDLEYYYSLHPARI
ncbi:MAG: methylated-DNA--[protein]-cysteine S-methyltransferase [Nitrospiraceae bacterium]|nr:methylated-DNA--[protein]-cysteine S-methyltransferase [Nitrospiraceae bacterium]